MVSPWFDDIFVRMLAPKYRLVYTNIWIDEQYINFNTILLCNISIIPSLYATMKKLLIVMSQNQKSLTLLFQVGFWHLHDTQDKAPNIKNTFIKEKGVP